MLGLIIVYMISCCLYTGVMCVELQVSNCSTILDFEKFQQESIFLYYNGTLLTDSTNKPCVVTILNHYNPPGITSTLCVRLYHEFNNYIDCDDYNGYFKLYFRTYGDYYYNCRHIRTDFCKNADKAFAEFWSWNTMKGYFRIEIYRSEQSSYNEYESGPNVGIGATVSIGVVVFGVCIGGCIALLRKSQTSNQNIRQQGNQTNEQCGDHSDLQVTPSAPQDQDQSLNLSAEPPTYTDIMAAEYSENTNNSTDYDHMQDDRSKPSAPPPTDNDSIPEEPPPPYSGLFESSTSL